MNLTHILYALLNTLQVILYIYLTSTGLYILFFALASRFRIHRTKPFDFKRRRIAVLIPCYKEDEVIFEVAKEALNQVYPKTHFDIIVIADKFEPGSLEKLRQLPIILYSADFKISTKTRALNFALKNLKENQYEIVVVLDADNVMEPHFLHKLNNSFSHGYKAVQGHRVAKNLNTNFAILDAVSEEINNNLFRKGHRVVGLSSALIGSAMAFDFNYFKEMMQDIEVVGGFDKEIELRLLSKRDEIEYLPDAYVYDEKVQNVKIFSQQRRRWLSAQFHYFGKHFSPATKAFFHDGNFDYFNKAIQYLQMPRILLLGSLTIIALATWFVNPIWVSVAWSLSHFFTICALLVSIPIKYYNFNTLKALAALPLGFIFMFLSLIKIRGANKKFIHTKHTYNAFQIKRK
ncbi:MAG: glycosyltransferase [Bacteroidales bacterium]|nr:glycosyltransferase [Bacteroidales bacterium]